MAGLGSGTAKRFYKTAVASADVDDRAGLGGFVIALDGRPLRTPKTAPLHLPSQALAEAIAGEWAAQDETIQPRTMPLTALACTAVDLVTPRRSEAVAEIAAYGETDLVCYRAEEPPALVAQQRATWQPLLDWAVLTFDAPLAVTTGILPAAQPEAAVASLARAVAAHDDLELAALATAVKASASLVIGLALSHGRVSAAAAFEAAELDESFQIERWGEDPVAAECRDLVRAELDAAARFLALLRG